MANEHVEGFNPDKKVGTIPFDSILNVKVSGFYYARILQVATKYAHDNQLDLLKTFEELKNREPKNIVEYNLVTLLSLCYAIEDAAQEQNIITERRLGDIMPDQGKSHES